MSKNARRDPPIPIRLPPALRARLDAAVTELSRHPAAFHYAKTNRNAVLRRAITLGLDTIEEALPAAARRRIEKAAAEG